MGPGGGQGCCAPASTCARGRMAPTHHTALAQTDGCQTAASLLGCHGGSCPGPPAPRSMSRASPSEYPEWDAGAQWDSLERGTDMSVGTNRPTHGHRHGHAHMHGDMCMNKGMGGCSRITGPLPARLGQQHPNPGAWVLGGLQAQGSAGPHVLPLARRYPPGQVVESSMAHQGTSMTGRAGSTCEEPVPGVSRA